MNRLPSELRRLYLPQATGGQDGDPEASSLIDASGRVRAMVLALARPADWAALSKVWQGVQVDLELPAPAIAVSGTDSYQLWFSLAAPLPAPQALAFLESLRLRYLSDIKAQRVGLMPAADSSSPLQTVHARLVPALQAESGHWSAFVAPELAPVFAEEPWLEMPPNPEGQSGLLSRLESIPLADFQRALELLRPTSMPVPSPPASDLAERAGVDLMKTRLAAPDGWRDPKRFLLDVMNNDAVALGLRIEAAKALLPYVDDPGRP